MNLFVVTVSVDYDTSKARCSVPRFSDFSVMLVNIA